MTQIFNFGAGPAVMPQAVLRKAQEELVEWHGSGMSVMEMSHRGKEFMGIAAHAESSLRALLGVPSSYKVLFLQGGASLQFAMVPINLLRGKHRADYVNTGEWSKKAISEAKRFCDVNVVASGESHQFTDIPAASTWKLSADAAYVHYTPNETIGGVEFPFIPDTHGVPLVADMSSTILSRPIDVSRFGLIYAGAQKNIGPSGLTVVIVREDLVGQALPGMPTMLDYQIHVKNDSMYNTPPTFPIYMAGLVFDWLNDQGGLSGMAVVNERKARLLYDCIEQSSGFYSCPVALTCRSWMNVPFTLKDPQLDESFLKESRAGGLLQLKGHRSVGGMRASLYNAMPEEGVRALTAFMTDFARRHG
ncbi:MAG TPA: 3-phosphoserine/phosphohydroxythreonine transaminase [Acidiferrobacter sp.]|nr:3-phosphoserine/phosphohydroxythreonine transaminase [Acidiferrobacter sp.]